MSRSRPHIFAAAILILAVLTTLCLIAPRMYPLHTDTSANFWYAATHVDLGATRERNDDIIVDRDRLIYSFEGRYGDLSYETIPIESAVHDFPAVQKELAKRAALNHPDDYFAKGYSHWKSIDRHLDIIKSTTDADEIRMLLQCIDQAQTNYYAETYSAAPAPHYNNFQAGLVQVAKASHLYWETVTFEALLFSFLILFAFWPYIHRATLRRKLIHIALVPLLLYLPASFSYCNLASPSSCLGGILYPYVTVPPAMFFDNFEWEIQLLERFPPILVVITQGRAVALSDYADLRYVPPPQPGPIYVVVLSALLTLLFAAYPYFKWLRQKHQISRRGFPVLEANNPQKPS